MIKMKNRFKRISGLVMALALISNGVIANAYPFIVGYHSINNSTNAEYKTEPSVLQGLADKLGTSDSYSEILNYSNAQTVNEYGKILAYLVENNLLSKDISIGVVDESSIFESEEFALFDYEKSNAEISKSDFLVTLTKAVYGVQESRPIVYKSSVASRVINGIRDILDYSNEYFPSGYVHKYNPEEFLGYDPDDDGQEDWISDFSKGDYSVYVTPNVYELYFKTLVDKGIISSSEFSNLELVSDLTYYGQSVGGLTQLPSWSNQLSYYGVNFNISNEYKVYGDSPLGQSFNLDEQGNLTYENTKWFFDEDLYLMDALTYIESILRLTEKDMTESEAQIINYKYGSMYYEDLDENAKSTLRFLIAKGILNFEDSSEFESLYKPLTSEMFCKLIYRVHNPNARLDFSKVQLTDNDNYWITQGFTQGQLTFVESSEFPYTDTSVEEITETASISNNRMSFFTSGSRPVTIASGFKQYKITRTFYPSITYYYKKTVIDKKFSKDSFDEVSDVSIEKDSSDNEVIKVTFNISASSPESAIAILDVNMSTGKQTSGIETIPTFNTIDEDGEKKYYVSKDALTNTKLPIKVIEDKYLMNTDTGARALFLEDNDIAIVGNQVIKTKDTMVFNLNGETHYNFKILAMLLGDTHIDKLDPGSVYVTSGTSTSDELYGLVGYTTSVVGTTEKSLGKAYVKYFNSSAELSSGHTSSVPYLNITQSNMLSNFVIMDVSKDMGVSNPLYMIVRLDYVVNKSMSSLYSNFDINSFLNSDTSISNVLDWAYQQPKSSETLNNWWVENSSFNNSLFNYMFGTKNVSYMKSGYLVPRITFLGETDEDLTSEKINSFFLNNLKLSTSISSTSYSGKSFTESFFKFNGDLVSSGNAALDSLKSSRAIKTYSKQTNKKVTDTFSDYKNYVVSASGQVYLNINYSSKMTIDASAKKVYQSTQEYQDPSFRVGALYTLTGGGKAYEYFCDAIGSNITLRGTEPLEMKLKEEDGNYKLYHKDGNLTAKDYLNSLRKTLLNTSSELTHLNLLTYKPRESLLEEEKVYYWQDKYYQFKNGSLKELDLSKSADKATALADGIYVFHTMTFNSQMLSASADNVIDQDYNFTFLRAGNFIQAGFTDQIIDSIVYNSSGYVSFSSLPQGSTVTIGDILFTKSGSNLVSEPISNTEVSNEFSVVDLGNGASTNENVGSLVARTFRNLNLNIVENGLITSNKLFSNYITKAEIGNSTSTKLTNTLIRHSGSLAIRNGKTITSYSSGTLFSSYVISIQLNEGLKFRPIGSTNEYTLVTVANSNVDGYLANYPYFAESLSYSDDDYFYANVNKSLFLKPGSAEYLFQQFKDLFSQTKQKDFLGILKYWVRLIMMWLLFANLMTAYLKRTAIDVILHDIMYPSNGKDGYDLYKWFTFGMQDYETKMSIGRAVVLGLVLFTIATLTTF